MNSEYIWIGNKHINSFGTNSQFWADYYYRMYREGTKMFYQLKTIMTYKHTGGGSGYYNDPVVAIFKMNYDGSPAYDNTFNIKPANNGTMYNGYTYVAESDWFSLDKTSGRINCFISINNSLYWGFDNPDFYFDLGIVPAISTLKINDGVYFDIDKGEGVPNVVSATLTKYDSSYVTKLKLSAKNNDNEIVLLRDYTEFNSSEFSLTEDEINKVYTLNPKWKMFMLVVELQTFTADGTILGTWSDDQPAKISETDLYPTLTASFHEINPKVIALLGESADIIVQNASVLDMVVTPTAHKKATISQVQLIHNNMAILKTESPYSHPFTAVNSIFSATVTDSRGLQNQIECTYTKNIIEYLPININKYNFKREAMTSSNIMLSADIQYKQTKIGTVQNTPIVKWKKDENDWVALTNNDYTIDETNNKIIINNLKLEDVLPYTTEGIFYLSVSDLLTEDNENKEVLRGIPLFDYGEYDFQINGDLFLADINRQNKKNIIDCMRPVNSLFLTMDKTNPSEYYKGTTWELVGKGKVLVGVDENDPDFSEPGKTGGKKDITLTIDQMPTHNHRQYFYIGQNLPGGTDAFLVYGNPNASGRQYGNYMSEALGGSQPHSNVQPYLTCYIWQRIS